MLKRKHHFPAERVALRTEGWYRLVLERIKAAVVIHRADSTIAMSNPAAQELLGLDEADLLDKSAHHPIWHFVRENGTPLPPDEYPVNQVLVTQKPLRDFVAGIHRAVTNDTIWVLVNADPLFDELGELSQVIVTFMDITKRKLSEERLKQKK